MPTIEEIYVAADRRGLGLAEYVRQAYNVEQLAKIETNIKTQLSSLRSQVSGFTEDSSGNLGIEQNLLCASREKLDLMQSRVRENLKAKMDELDSFVESDVDEACRENVCVASHQHLFVEE